MQYIKINVKHKYGMRCKDTFSFVVGVQNFTLEKVHTIVGYVNGDCLYLGMNFMQIQLKLTWKIFGEM